MKNTIFTRPKLGVIQIFIGLLFLIYAAGVLANNHFRVPSEEGSKLSLIVGGEEIGRAAQVEIYIGIVFIVTGYLLAFAKLLRKGYFYVATGIVLLFILWGIVPLMRTHLMFMGGGISGVGTPDLEPLNNIIVTRFTALVFFTSIILIVGGLMLSIFQHVPSKRDTGRR